MKESLTKVKCEILIATCAQVFPVNCITEDSTFELTVKD